MFYSVLLVERLGLILFDKENNSSLCQTHSGFKNHNTDRDTGTGMDPLKVSSSGFPPPRHRNQLLEQI